MTKMIHIKGTISENLDNEFRKEVARRFGTRRGALSKALEQALWQWISKKPIKSSDTAVSPYSVLKDHLITEYSGKYCVLKDNEVVVASNSVVEAVRIARDKFPNCKKFNMVHAVPKKNSRAQLSWRNRRFTK